MGSEWTRRGGAVGEQHVARSGDHVVGKVAE